MIVIDRARRRIFLLPLLVHVLTTATGLEISLRRRRLDRVFTDVAQIGRERRISPQIGPATIERAIRAVYRLLPFEWTCLKHALIFARIRRNQRLPGRVRIGVRKRDGVFGAHAWVDDGCGNVLTDPLDGFNPLPMPRGSIPNRQAID